MSLGGTYRKLLKNHFLAVQAVQTGAMMGAGDSIAQLALEKTDWRRYDLKRTALFAGLGLCFVGPTLTVWYRVLGRRFGHASSSPSTTAKKVLCDQLVFAPTFLGAFVAILNLSKGRQWAEVRQEIRANYVDLVMANWKLWPAVQIVNFYFLPLHYQVVFVQGVAILWNTYLSWKTNK